VGRVTRVAQIGELALVALVTWSAISVVVVLAFGAMIRNGRQSWNTAYETDRFADRFVDRAQVSGTQAGRSTFKTVRSFGRLS
jgi:hypothetical protein